MTFDEWFEETYPEYVIKETHTFLEPYYSIAEEAYATGGKESADDFKNMKAGLESEIARLKEIVIKVKRCAYCDVWLHNQDIKLCENCACVEAVNVLRNI